MKFDMAPIRSWFGYSRRERRASFILLILIFFVISVRFLVPERRFTIENIPLNMKEDNSDSIPVIKAYSNEVKVIKHDIQKKRSINVDINRCDTSELIKLPGIGPVLSVRIVKYRLLLGGYARKEQLREVYGLSPETYEIIKEMVTVDTLFIKRVDINSADYRGLSAIRYFEKNEINSILKFRELEGRIGNIRELVDNKIINDETAWKVRPYLMFK
jgi:DNA uptake protein ComE-like DNA-binding protein